ncbi:MAG TPA: hypothetical protein VLE02_01030 [Nitrosarchaeum sp.]|nr:hypothetical protein [Nitrosarchaeum sp.]
MNLKYLSIGIAVIFVVSCVVYFLFKKRAGSTINPTPPDPPLKPEVFAIAAWDYGTSGYSKTWALTYNTAKYRSENTVNLPIATYDQVRSAWQSGFCVCNWGWIQPMPNFDLVLPNHGTGGDACGGSNGGFAMQKLIPPASNASCIFVYGPKPRFDPDANDPRSPLYRGYVILPFEFGRSKNRWSQYD